MTRGSQGRALKTVRAPGSRLAAGDSLGQRDWGCWGQRGTGEGYGAPGLEDVSRSLCGLSFNLLVCTRGYQPGPGAPGSISQGARSDVARLEDEVLDDRGRGLQGHFRGGQSALPGAHIFPLGGAGDGWATQELASGACRSGQGGHGNSEREGVVVQVLGHPEALALRLAWASGTRGAVVGSEVPARTLDGAWVEPGTWTSWVGPRPFCPQLFLEVGAPALVTTSTHWMPSV